VYKFAAAAILTLYLLSFSTAIHASQQRPSEYEVKAAYLLNFLKFVRWPVSSEGTESFIPICILGEDPFGAALDNIVSGQQIDGKRVVPRRISRPADMNGCRILFIDLSESGQLGRIFEILGNLPVLTVSEIPNFASRGGIIQFVLKDGRVRFEINVMNAQRIGLTLSSQLLNVASAVRP
jgi:hypothetical protein